MPESEATSTYENETNGDTSITQEKGFLNQARLAYVPPPLNAHKKVRTEDTQTASSILPNKHRSGSTLRSQSGGLKAQPIETADSTEQIARSSYLQTHQTERQAARCRRPPAARGRCPRPWPGPSRWGCSSRPSWVPA